MLRFLSISNFALIDHLEVDFGPGLNLLTGETGSGKSILVDAVGLLIGKRASSEMVRAGFERARVEGIFEVAGHRTLLEKLNAAGIETDGGELIIRRDVTRSGANKVFANGVLITLGLLQEMGPLLVDIHGQHDQQVLLQPTSHVRFLDAFGGLEDDRRQVAQLARELRRVIRQIDEIQRGEQQRLRQIDLLRYQVKEIDSLQLVPGIEEELETEKTLLASSEKRFQESRRAYALLYEDEESALTLLDRVNRSVDQLAQLDPESFSQPVEKLAEARYQLDEIAFELRDYADSVEINPQALEAVQQRLMDIQQAKRKYGNSVEAVLEFRDQSLTELDELRSQAASVERLGQQQEQLQTDYLALSKLLSKKRHKAARKLEKLVEHQLQDLAMEATRFVVKMESVEAEFPENGLEVVEFLISPNPGEPPKPLSRIASGGELSRIVLALTSILQLEGGATTLVFDEIDSGIGGRVASSLAQKLARLAEGQQVFCVTHLAQVAANAARHFRVAKETRDGRTLIGLAPLRRPEEREAELARMLAGREVTDTTLRQAREMLKT